LVLAYLITFLESMISNRSDRPGSALIMAHMLSKAMRACFCVAARQTTCSRCPPSNSSQVNASAAA
jgi:hypothetical protein